MNETTIRRRRRWIMSTASWLAVAATVDALRENSLAHVVDQSTP